jgi:hypothetical protein
VATEAEVQNLLVDATTACDVTFPMQTVNDLATALEECLQALLTRIRAIMSEVVHQGAAMALVTTQL